MSRFGWAFVNDIVTGSGGSPGGSDKQVQFNSGSAFSGSSNFTYDYTTNTLYLTGTLRADSLIVSSSQILKSGSTIFGDDVGDTHQFTGSLYNTTLVSGTTARFTTITGSTVVTTLITGSTLTISASVISASSYLGITAGATPGGSNTAIQFNSGSSLSGSSNLTFDYTNNILSGTTARFTTITGSTVTGSTALFTQITGNVFGTASFATNANSATTVTNGVYTNGNNTFTGINTFNTYYITGSITGSDAKFTSISGSLTGSGAGLTSIPNGALVNSSVTVGSTAISLGGTATTIQGITELTGSTVTGSTALFTTITGSAYSGGTFTGTNGRFTSFRATGATTFDAAMAVSGGISVVNSLVRVLTGSTPVVSLDNFGVVSGSGNFLVGGNLTVAGASTVAHVVSQGSLSAKYQSFTGSFVVPLASWLCGINTSASAVTASLALANTYFAGQPIIFKDIGGFAGTAGKGILIQASGSDKIDGASSLTISAASGSVTVVTDGVSNFFITAIV